MGIRKLTALDFGPIRQLPVQLTGSATPALQLKKLRLMMNDANIRMFVEESGKKVNAFLALQFMPSADCALNFLLITHFSVDRFAVRQGAALAVEEQVVCLAKENRSAAILVRSDKLGTAALRFYQQRGYTVSADILMKKLETNE